MRVGLVFPTGPPQSWRGCIQTKVARGITSRSRMWPAIYQVVANHFLRFIRAARTRAVLHLSNVATPE